MLVFTSLWIPVPHSCCSELSWTAPAPPRGQLSKRAAERWVEGLRHIRLLNFRRVGPASLSSSTQPKEGSGCNSPCASLSLWPRQGGWGLHVLRHEKTRTGVPSPPCISLATQSYPEAFCHQERSSPGKYVNSASDSTSLESMCLTILKVLLAILIPNTASFEAMSLSNARRLPTSVLTLILQHLMGKK